MINLDRLARRACLLLLLVLPPASFTLGQDAPPFLSGPEHTPPQSRWDQEHLRLDLRFDVMQQRVSGEALLRLRALETPPPDSVVVFAAGLSIDGVLVGVLDSLRMPVAFHRSAADSLVISLPTPSSVDSFIHRQLRRPASDSLAAPQDTLVPPKADSLARSDSLQAADSLSTSDSLGTARDSLRTVDSLSTTADSLAAPDSVYTRADSLHVAFDSLALHISYTVQPKLGLHVTSSEDAPQRTQIWTRGAPTYYRHWFPSTGVPGDKLTSEITATVPSTLRVLSNGSLIDERANDDGTVSYQYRQDQPHAAHLIALVAGDYDVVRDSVTLDDGSSLPLAYWIPPERIGDVARTFGRTPAMLRFFSDRLDAPFPWASYAQAVVRGMPYESTPATSMTTFSHRLLLDERATLDYSPDSLIARQLAHQWFGSLVTASYWSDAWLHEGLASYLSALFTEHSQGDTAFSLTMQRVLDTYLDEAEAYRRPLVWNRWDHPERLFDAHSAQKGAWIIHMLRRQLGDAAFWNILNHYLNSHAFESVTTVDFTESVEAATNQDLSTFFEQWVYAAGHPLVEVTYTYHSDRDEIALTLRQTQQSDRVPDAFDLAFAVEVYTLRGSERVDVRLDTREKTVTLPVSTRPRFILIDPDQRILAEWHVEQSVRAWVAQLRYAASATDRLQAARTLAQFTEEPALFVGLRSALENESHSAIRAAIVRTMGALPPSSSIERALLDASGDEASGVRAAVLETLGAYEESSEVAALAFRAAQNDRSYRVQATAVTTLARIGAADAPDVVRSALVTPSHRDVIRQAALDALRHLDLPDQEGLNLALDYSRPTQSSSVRAAALRYLHTLADTQRRALDRLIAALRDPDVRVRHTAIRGLGALDSERARTALERHLDDEVHPLLVSTIRQMLQSSPTSQE